MSDKKSTSNAKALKSGIWYTISHFVRRSIGFFTTPIFSRMLTKTEFGSYSNFSSWYSLLAILVTLHMVSATPRAKYDFEDDFDEYLSSVVFFGFLVTLACYVVVLCFPTFFEGLMNLDMKYIHVLFFLLLFSPALNMLQLKRRYDFKYKEFVVLAVFLTFASTVSSVFLVTHLENKLDGRIYGTHIPEILIYLVSFIIVMAKGRTFFRFDCWKYAALYSIPIIPHLLSNLILGSSDKIMITKMVGAEANATYSLAYSCGMIVSVFFTSLNQAMSPWLFAKLHEKDYEIIRKVNRVYIVIFAIGLEGIILVAPELMYILGGTKYHGAEYLVPPVMLGYGFKFAYTIYQNVEQYEKKMYISSVGTLAAALFNFVANLICIPIFGYQAAAYTTLAGFVLLLLIHYWMSRRMNIVYMYDNRFVFIVMGLMSVFGLIAQTLYFNTYIRWGVIVLLAVTFCILAYKTASRYGLWSLARGRRG